MIKDMAARVVDFALCKIAVFITGIRPSKQLKQMSDLSPKIYYANHTSHGDFLLIFVSMPYKLRKQIRPVAGADYWTKGKIRPFLARHVFNMFLIDRKSKNPLEYIEKMGEALKTHSLIIFPEGTRKMDDDIEIGNFKSGIYRLAKANPNVNLVPLWINNIQNVLPKGFCLPIPLICDICVGDEFRYENEDKFEFLAKAKEALLSLKKDEK